jgi:tuftelin-interacting protein 11
MPQLQAEVEGWNPLTDTVPIHAWVHPWLPLMGTRLHAVYPTIRHKLATALTKWHPSDPSAKLILQPWAPVFEKGVTDIFLIKNIVPKLALCLQEFIINPHQQQLDAWDWVMEWQDLLPVSTMTSLLDNHFFPKWLQVLSTWLSHSPNYEEVTQWYVGWKNLVPKHLIQVPSVRDQFNRALDLMNRAVSISGAQTFQPGAREHVAYLASVERQQESEVLDSRRDHEALAQAVRSSGSSSSYHLGFKELLERKAEESGLVFVPVPNRYHEGKQIYRLGRVQMVLDRGVVFVQADQSWSPVSMGRLLEMAK